VDVRIEPWGAGDGALLAALVGDPAMMEHLGGAESPQKVAERQAKYAKPGSGMFKVVAGGEGVGSVGFWPREERDGPAYETGWSILPAHQGKGIAKAATALVVAEAAAAGDRRFLYAYPSVDNAPSNAICRALGFTLLGPEDFEYPPGHTLHCNVWRLDLQRRQET
jgi:RimJ/RimL family protein N-acetyltransferase